MLACLLTSCTAITVQPSCPTDVLVGETIAVEANEMNPGAIATYLWEAIPAEAGTFADPTAADTTFTADATGDVTLRLTASDGLFQMIAECPVTIDGFLGVAVTFIADPNPVVVGETSTLFCASLGTDEAIVFGVAQVDGGGVELTQLAPGVATITPTQIGDLTFRCVGEDDSGGQTEPALVTVTVVQTLPDAGGNDNSGTGTGTGTDNSNDNGDIRRPPRSGG